MKLVLSPVHHPTLQAGLSGDQWQRSLQLLVQLERAAARGASCLLSALLPLPLACGTTLNHVPCACHRHTGIASGGTVAVLLLLRYHVHFCTLSTSISFERPLCTPPPRPLWRLSQASSGHLHRSDGSSAAEGALGTSLGLAFHGRRRRPLRDCERPPSFFLAASL